MTYLSSLAAENLMQYPLKRRVHLYFTQFSQMGKICYAISECLEDENYCDLRNLGHNQLRVTVKNGTRTSH